ncbi:MAG: LPXTG cell wall anchor domain-containing protein [Lachnospiraceae bacterium]|nr:LPXTG cell wall anchor domain-containing protein [Lachnospiraceae bacterium]
MVTGGALEDDQFSFTMYEGDSTLSADTPIEELTVVSTGTSKADGSIDFTEIHYTMATRGTHYYVIYEDADKTIDGVLNSFEPVFVIVQVLNNGDGTFTIIDNFYIDVESTDEGGNSITERVEVETVVIHNKATETKFDVVNEAGENIADADIEIRDLDGNVITTYTSTEETQTIHGLKVNTVYVMHETDAPFGYVLGEDIYFMLDEDGNLIILDSPEDTEGTPADAVVMTNELTKTKINIIDPEGTNLPGAELEILDEEGNVVGTLTSSDQTDIYEGLDVNTKYTLHEVKAPDGYVLGEDITFWIDENGNLYIVDEEGNDVPVESLDMTNEKTKVEINIIDPEGTHLPGAELEIIDKDGNVVGKITTEGETVIYEGLVTGEDYILRETKAPDGYLPDDDIHFWIDENGNLFIVDEDGNDVPAESLDMTNEKTKVDISVEDPDGNNIPGGKFEIIDPDGNVVDEFISSGDIDTIIGLITGKDYILHQVEAPDGYEPSEDIHFWIDEDGGLHILDKDGNEYMDDKIVVVNEPVVEPGSPATGDDSNIAPMAIIALMAMAMFVIALKKKEEENC